MAKEDILCPLLGEEPLGDAIIIRLPGGGRSWDSTTPKAPPRVVEQPQHSPMYGAMEMADLVGGCSCSWGFSGWSTPPGGDQQKCRRRRAMCISAGIVAVIFSILAVICYFSGPFDIVRHSSTAAFHTVHLSIGRTLLLHIHGHDVAEDRARNRTSPLLLDIVLGRNIPQHVPYTVRYGGDGSTLGVDFEHFASLTVEHAADENVNPRFHCYNISWVNKGAPGCTFEDALVLGDAHWYGGAPVHKQKWPVEKLDHPSREFITGYSNDGYYGGIQARYWLSSNGVAIHVDWAAPLFIAINHNNDGFLSLTSKCEYPYTHPWRSKPSFRYSLCHDQDGNMKHAHQHTTRKFIPKPQGIPDTRLFSLCQWSTRARYKKKLNQNNILEFSREIKEHGFSPAQLEIDDDWTSHYGDFDFDKSKFSDPEAMVKELNELGFKVTLWTHPFASPFSKAFYTGSGKQYWVQNWLLDLPAIIVWGDGLGALLDVTNPKAVEWHMDKLTELQAKYGIHSFKFDDGEGAWLPTWHRTHQHIHNPNDYTKLYANMAYRSDPQGRSQEVRAGSGTQDLPLFTRIKEKYSNWGYDNGLKTLIPHVLTFGIIGFPFVLPDMIGGNSHSSSSSVYPDRELYIRWLQACVFFPSMQFSLPPWHYDDEVTAIAKDMYALHRKYSEYIIELAKEATETGAPIVRPLWWVCPRDPECQSTDSQFLLGNKVLVAPVLDEGARSRDIYLPYGVWEDQLFGGVIKGPMWMKSYPADLHQLPFFTRI